MTLKKFSDYTPQEQKTLVRQAQEARELIKKTLAEGKPLPKIQGVTYYDIRKLSSTTKGS